MHTVEILEQSLAVAERLGYQIRHEWLGGSGGGHCEFGGKKWIFLDLSLNVVERLEQVLLALRSDPGIYLADLGPELRNLLGVREAA